MDISFWAQHNPKITVGHTTKKFFGKYLYKLILYVPAGRLINSKGDISINLEHRKNYNAGGSWWHQRNQILGVNSANVSTLETIRTLKHDTSLKIKLRVEEPRVQIYAETEQELKDIILNYLANLPSSTVESIYGPEDEDSEAVLNAGAIIRKNDLGYKYKITLKDGMYPFDVRNGIAQYLINLGPEMVRVPKGTYDHLTRSNGWIWNCYFYSNDLDLNTFIHLMGPGLISNCHELVVMPHK